MRNPSRRKWVIVLWCVTVEIAWLSSTATDQYSAAPDSLRQSLNVARSSVRQLEHRSLIAPATWTHYARVEKFPAERYMTGPAPEEVVRTFRWLMHEQKLRMGFQGIEAGIKLLLGPNIVWPSAVLTRLLPGVCVGLGFLTGLFALGHQLVKRSLDL